MTGPAVVLLSGGIDSATVLAMAAAAGHECHALTFRYGQRHVIEVEAAGWVAAAAGARTHVIADVDLSVVSASPLTGASPIPARASADDIPPGISPTYVPARNTVFLAHALAYAESAGARDIFIGVSATDYDGYPDCRPEYLEAFERMAGLATAAALAGNPPAICAPLAGWDKAQVIRHGLGLGVDYSLTWSCYNPQPPSLGLIRPCGRCDACLLRADGFARAGAADPLGKGTP